MTHQEKHRFYLALNAMEQEGDLAPLESALEDRLVERVLAEQRAQRLRRRAVMAAGALTLAACFTIFVGLRRPRGPLPSYQLYTAGDDQTLGSPVVADSLRLSVDSVLRVELRPQQRTREKATALAFLREDGALRAWPITFARSQHGVLLLQAPAHALGLRPGHYDLIFAIGRDDRSPTLSQIDAAVSHNQPSLEQGWQLLHKPIDILAR